MTDNAPRPPESERPTPSVASALDLAIRGFHVFPIEAGTKDRPLVRWSRQATADPTMVRRFWARWPDANVGIATGPSGLLVLDVDQKHGKDGTASLRLLQALYEPLPSTLTSRTASGGRHLLFRGSARNSVCKLGDGLDVRSSGGYIIAPGSRLAGGGSYEWENDAPVADAPVWLIEAASERKRADYPADSKAGSISPSHLALILAELDVEEYRAHDHWLDIMMASHHATAGLGVEQFIEWSTRDPQFAADADEIRYRWDSLRVSPDGRRPITERTLFDAVIKRVGYVPHCDPAEDFEPVEVDAEIEVEASPRRGRFRVFRPSELLSRPKPRWLIRGVIRQGELVVIYGPPKTFKTFLLLGASLCIATGTEFYGREVESGTVLYVVGEGNDELFGERIKAWCDAHGLPLPDDTLIVVADRPDIGSPEDVAEIAALTRPKLIVLDTLARTMTGDENSPADMARYVRGCDRLREMTGAAVCVIHHEGKDERRGMMGHTKLRGALDTSIRMHRKKDIVWAEMVDQRNGPGDLALGFRLDGQVLTLTGEAGHDETPDEDFLDGAALTVRVRRLVADMAGSGKTKLVEAAMKEFGWKRMTARRHLDAAVPTGRSRSCAVEFEGGRVWFETPETDHPSPPATARYEVPLSRG